jgi:pilus assembly protein Flp/PilA
MLRARIVRLLRRLRRNQSGATAIEYALIAAGVAAVLVGTIATLGTNLSTLWTTIKTALH